jgi:hypothetical protein
MSNFKALGVSGLTRYGGYVYEEFLTDLRWPDAGKVYKEMSSNDPIIGSVLYLAEMMIRRVTWEVKPASTSQEDADIAKFVESCMHDMDESWADNINEILSILTYGFSFHETLYKIRRGKKEKNKKYRSKYSDGKIGWRGFPIRSQGTLLEWEFDEETGDANAFVQLAPPNYKRVAIPFCKGLLFRTKVSRNNPEGKSLLRNAYRPWYFKKRIEEIEGIGVERDLAGFPVLQAPEGLDLWDTDDERMVALKANAESLITNIRRDSEEGVLLPYGWELKLLSTGSSRQFDTNSIINRYDSRLAITLLSDIVLLGNESSGSFALSDTKRSLLAAALESLVKNIASTFNNTAIPKLLDLNGIDVEAYPTIEPGEIEVPDLKEIALILRAMGLDISKDMDLMNFIRKISSMPQLNKETFEEIYKNISEEDASATKEDYKTRDLDDAAQNSFEQADMAYTGG